MDYCRATCLHLFDMPNSRLHIGERVMVPNVHSANWVSKKLQVVVGDHRTLDFDLTSWLAIVLSRTSRVLEIHAEGGHSPVAALVFHVERLDMSLVVAKPQTLGW